MKPVAFGSALVGALALASLGRSAEPLEPFLRELPAGIVLVSSVEVPAAQVKPVGQRLGGEIVRLTNSHLRVHGRPIQVNVITAAEEAGAKAILAGLAKVKSYPYCLRQGRLVIEYVGRSIDAPLAHKTSYELGFEQKPRAVRYRVVARLATVDKADYMACNPLFNHFLAFQRGNREALQQIESLAAKFQFGHSLALRSPDLASGLARHNFEPTAASSRSTASTVVYSFDKLPQSHGIPYVTATLEVPVDNSGFVPSSASPPPHLTAATAFWPSDDREVVALARQITAGAVTNDEKVHAILQWLKPGANLKYSGQTGSRWGTAKVLEQKFGHCWDFSDCFVTLARAAGVPSRQVAGWLYGSSGHVWAEFYREGKGFQQVDPTGGGELPCGIYHIAYFTSDDGDMPIVYLAMPTIEAVRGN